MAKKQKFKLLVDVVEWFDYSNLNYGGFGPLALDVHWAMTRLIPKADGVIAISSFLENYYRMRGVKTLRIPQLVDLEEDKWNFVRPEPFDPAFLNLVYAGSPARKDLIGNAVIGLKRLVRGGAKVKLHLFGPTPEELRVCLGRDQALVEELQGKALHFHGLVSQEAIPALLAKADFSVLLRPDARYAHAGFPTKLTESFAAGVPAIANLTGDIGLYLRDGENGFVLPDWSPEAFEERLKPLLHLSPDRKQSLRESARMEAFRCFDFRNYLNPLTDFIIEVEAGNQGKTKQETL